MSLFKRKSRFEFLITSYNLSTKKNKKLKSSEMLKLELLVGRNRKPDNGTVPNTVNQCLVLKEIEIRIVITSYNLSTEKSEKN